MGFLWVDDDAWISFTFDQFHPVDQSQDQEPLGLRPQLQSDTIKPSPVSVASASFVPRNGA